MKKFIPIVVIVFLLASCQLSSPNDTILTNHSSRTVTVNLRGASEIVLAPHGQPGYSTAIETRRDMNPRERMQSFSPHQRVRFIYTNSTLTFEFFDRNRYGIRILNLSGQAGVLSADAWMNNPPFGSQNTEQAGGWFVYTGRPAFSARICMIFYTYVYVCIVLSQ